VPATSHPEINIYFDGNGGTAAKSTILWDHPDMMAGLRRMFHAKDDEDLTAITINETGIQASFQTKRPEKKE
jgi:hypothetical protein